jgi:hypothetical protein
MDHLSDEGTTVSGERILWSRQLTSNGIWDIGFVQVSESKQSILYARLEGERKKPHGVTAFIPSRSL